MPQPAARRPRLRPLALMLGALALLAAGGAAAQSAQEAPERARTPASMPVFERPELERRLRAARGRLSQGDAIGAEIALRGAVGRFPELAALHFALARLQARRGDAGAAIASLRAAAQAGARGAQRLEAPVFAPLRAREAEMAALRQAFAAPPPPTEPPRAPAAPAPLTEGAAVLTPANSEWSEEEGVLRAYFAPPEPSGRPELALVGRGETALALNRLLAAGRAAGNVGDFYENRDEEHSMLDLERFPQLTPVEHGPAAREAGFHRALPEGLAISAGGEAPPLLGNASVAVTGGAGWRSMARLSITEDGRAAELWRQYASNQIYVYPEHKDHDPFFGDVFPANTPYWIVSQGSSYTDRRAMESVATILAAFRPETKRRLIAERLIAPTVQMIWRRGQRGIGTDDAYLSGRAHPTVFDPERAEPGRMVELANGLEPGEIPPVVRLSVLQESSPTPGVTLFGDGLSEALLDTPSAVARVMRGTGASKRMVISAAGTRDPNDRELSFAWLLLRGDPEKVRIRPLGARGEGAEIEVDWHDETETPLTEMASQRVDIGVFAHNGAEWSAPAFVSVTFPPRQKRSWDEAGRLQMVDYDAAGLQDRYQDPWLYPRREWRDVYAHDADGRPLGWTRTGRGGFARFTRHGARVETEDAQGRPETARILGYPMPAGPKQRREVMQAASDRILRYAYEGPDDRQGAASPEAAPAPAEAQESVR